MVLDRRLLHGDIDRRESISDLTNQLVLSEGRQDGGHGFVEGCSGYLDTVLDTFEVRY
jgi:hypothetical protein